MSKYSQGVLLRTGFTIITWRCYNDNVNSGTGYVNSGWQLFIVIVVDDLSSKGKLNTRSYGKIENLHLPTGVSLHKYDHSTIQQWFLLHLHFEKMVQISLDEFSESCTILWIGLSPHNLTGLGTSKYGSVPMMISQNFTRICQNYWYIFFWLIIIITVVPCFPIYIWEF